MQITRVTLDWYRQKMKPRWAAAVVAKERKISIDSVLNSQADAAAGRRPMNHEANNLLALCRSYRKFGILKPELRRLATQPCGTDSKRRTAWALKWYRRLCEQECGK